MDLELSDTNFPLQLFAPRGPLAYYRPLDKDIERVTPKHVGGIADFLHRAQEENAQGIIAAGREAMEEGEEPTFSMAEETKRELRREERRKKKEEELNLAKETCQSWSHQSSVYPHSFSLDKPSEDPNATQDPYKTLFIGRLVSRSFILSRNSDSY